MPRTVRLLLALAVALGLATAVAAAAVPVGATYDGTSSHKRYAVRVLTQCFTSGCHRATTIAVQVTTGNAKRPNAACVYGTFQLGSAKLRKGETFSASGSFIGHGRVFGLKATGKFVSSHAVKGKISGPKVCGGTQTYKAVWTPGG
jgi:hypothetical protein